MIHIILAVTLFSSFGNLEQKDIQLIGYTNGKPIVIDASWIPGKDLNNNLLYLRTDAAQAWRDMVVKAAKDGIFLEPTYAFRDHNVQKRLKRRNPNSAALPGYSPHEAGLAVDINNCTRTIKKRKIKTAIYWWLHQYGKDFGFIQTMQNEPWHWEWVDIKRNS
jgi:LAS superfamily LD-carboxypeptidase LdcB